MHDELTDPDASDAKLASPEGTSRPTAPREPRQRLSRERDRFKVEKRDGRYRFRLAGMSLEVGRPGTGHEAPRENMPPVPSPEDTDAAERAAGDATATGSASVELEPLLAHLGTLEERVQQLTEAATVWQIRALRAEEQLKQLPAVVDDASSLPVPQELQSEADHQAVDVGSSSARERSTQERRALDDLVTGEIVPLRFTGRRARATMSSSHMSPPGFWQRLRGKMRRTAR